MSSKTPNDPFFPLGKSTKNQPDRFPERPLECTECKKPIKVIYTEIVGDVVTSTSMCADCPELQRRLHGSPSMDAFHGAGEKAGLACGNCGTTLEEIRVGHPLGCSTCYEVFDEVILSELINEQKLPQRMINNKRNMPLHIGRAPGETQEISATVRLLALNEALTETLKREDYEQAALLRDQIKKITEADKGKNKDEGK